MNHKSEIGKTNPGLKELNNKVGKETEEHEGNEQTKKKIYILRVVRNIT
jgi:hypothetical protein